MLVFGEGDILAGDADAVVNTVNCVGVMGAGLALQFKNAYPENFRAYKRACDAKLLEPGGLQIFDRGSLEPPHYIVNFATKGHWKGKSRLADIRKGLVALRDHIITYKIGSIAVPPLGCGLGGLDWSEVLPLIEATLGDLPGVTVVVYPPAGAPREGVGSKSKTAPNMTPGRAALIALARKYLSQVWEPQITLLEVHKLAYFLQAAGQPLRLDFNRGHYGPYARNLRNVLSHMQGHFIDGYLDAHDVPDTEIGLRAEAVAQAQELLAQDEETLGRFETVARLVEGFEGPYGLETLATVAWLVEREQSSRASIVADFQSWNRRKSKFEVGHILKAYDVLEERGWMEIRCANGVPTPQNSPNSVQLAR
jgi:O-acetyl-ADP-ribose deacetylase (regulator of RNase III)